MSTGQLEQMPDAALSLIRSIGSKCTNNAYRGTESRWIGPTCGLFGAPGKEGRLGSILEPLS